MKQTILFVSLMFTAICGWAQNYSVKPQKAVADDYIALLNFAQYNAYSFDVSSLIDSTRVFEFYFREYEHESMVAEKRFCVIKNRSMISDYNESDQKEIHEEGSAFDEANDVYKVAKKVLVGFLPFKNDSIERAYINIENMGRSAFQLPIRPAVNTKTGVTMLEYRCVPYKTSSFELNKFIPLVLYGSVWCDEKYGIFRFCTEKEIDPNKGASKQADMPHYYIVGLIVK